MESRMTAGHPAGVTHRSQPREHPGSAGPAAWRRVRRALRPLLAGLLCCWLPTLPADAFGSWCPSSDPASPAFFWVLFAY